MVYLASRSPRRAELLRQIGVVFSIHDIDIDESRSPGESASDYVCRIARAKARTAADNIRDLQHSDVVLAADTTIHIDNDIIGKPADRGQCHHILQQLSGRQHQVLTAVAVVNAQDLAWRLSSNQVSFRTLSTLEIESYCATPEPMDKAGAYAIQGKAALFVDHLRGSYSAVMGLPLFETAELLQNAGIELF